MKTDIKINKIGEAEVEIAGELAALDFASFRPQAIKAIGENAQIDGFRKGHIPEKILIEKVGEEKILLEMSEVAISQIYPDLLQENNIDAIGRPAVTITKLAKDNPLGFKITTATMPKITLADYKAIAKEVNGEKDEEIKITDQEVNDVLENLRKQRATHDHAEHNHKEGEKCDHEPILPELNDDFAKALGQFETLSELKTKVQENLDLEKKYRAKEKKRLKIVDEINKKSEMTIPKILIEAEKDKMMAEMEGQIGQMGLNFDDYLNHLKKTREELMTGWDKDAKYRVEVSLILNEIARVEKIGAPEEELTREVDYLKKQYPTVDERRLKSYAGGLIINEKVFEFLENQK
ncbi:MAG: trigger factor [Candidatus Vogelbacteria bacterium]|nr:trigger factor [Candidatus Vogelbacteria bacterium]